MKSEQENTRWRELNIVLADDDKDDCLLFKEALDEVLISTRLTSVHDGQQLMQLLTKHTDNPFDVLFLDLNMPRKNGFACLKEIKSDNTLKHLPIIIISTSFDENISDLLYENGANYYICKPPDFSELKKLIRHVLSLIVQNNISPSSKEGFFIGSLKSPHALK